MKTGTKIGIGVAALIGVYFLTRKTTPGTALPPGQTWQGYRNDTSAIVYINALGQFITAAGQVIHPNGNSINNVPADPRGQFQGTVEDQNGNQVDVYADGNGGFIDKQGNPIDAWNSSTMIGKVSPPSGTTNSLM